MFPAPSAPTPLPARHALPAPRLLTPFAALVLIATLASMLVTVPALADNQPTARPPDPLAVHSLAPPSALGSLAGKNAGDGIVETAPCRFAAPAPNSPALSLADIVDRALCGNPLTRAAWAATRAQAALAGVARSAYLPSVSGTLSAGRNRSDGSTSSRSSSVYNQGSLGLSASYLLYDFGARDATLENALQGLAATRLTQDSTLQKVFFNAVQAYYTLFAARAAVDDVGQG